MNNKEVKLVNSMKEYIISLEKIGDQDKSRSLCISMAKWRRSQNVKSLSLNFIYDSYII